MNVYRQGLFVAAWATILAPWNIAVAATIACPDVRLAEADWVAKHLREADVVVLGEVFAETRVSPSVPASAASGEPQADDSMQELLDLIAAQQLAASSPRYFQSVSVNVLQQWKGPAKPDFEFTNPVHPGQFGWYLREGRTYLIFAYRQADGTYAVRTICAETRDAAAAQNRMALLDDLIKQQQEPDPP